MSKIKTQSVLFYLETLPKPVNALLSPGLKKIVLLSHNRRKFA